MQAKYSNYRLDVTQAKLAVLYAKQGRAQQFTSQAARDKYLDDEIEALRAYEQTQQSRVEELSRDVDGAKEHMAEVLARSESSTQQDEDRRKQLKEMSQEVTELRAKVDAMQEKRK